MFICAAYYLAYALRFEGTALAKNIFLMKQSLPWLILIKMSIFFSLGLYRGLWKYISIPDFFTIFKAVSLGSVASVLFLTFVYRFKDYSRAVFFIDWLVLLFLITGSRFLFRMIGEFFIFLNVGAKKILIFGAGDTGEMLIREIKRNKELRYFAIGFIDDDPRKKGTSLQGIPVLGSRRQAKGLIERFEINEIIVAIPSLGLTDLAEISQLCSDCGITFRRVRRMLQEDEEGGVSEFGKN
jgi:UDP-GlcNAc:undecaprenyl-phosphate GlcNAc-1-phosphate transferase